MAGPRIYTLPNFNLLIQFWTGGHTPTTHPADIADVPGQIYENSKGLLDIQPGLDEYWVPPLYLRLPKTEYLPVTGDVLADNIYVTRYYRVRWVQRIHIGFPNEYISCVIEHCDSAGVAGVA